VENALGFARASAGVENEEGMFAVERLGLADGADLLGFLMHPEVAARGHRNFLLGALYDKYARDLGRAKQCLVDIAFDGELGAAPVSAVGRDDYFRSAIVDPFLERFGAESAEDHAMRRADASASQHGDDRLGNHGQVNHDAVARFDAVLLQHIGHEADLTMELLVGEGEHIARFSLEDDCRFVAQRAL